MIIAVSSTASIFINVLGDGFTCQNYQLNNFNATSTLWNFYEATFFSFQNVRWEGSVLAPWANIVNAQNGAIDGQVFANSWTLTNNCMQQNWVPFVGCLPSAGYL